MSTPRGFEKYTVRSVAEFDVLSSLPHDALDAFPFLIQVGHQADPRLGQRLHDHKAFSCVSAKRNIFANTPMFRFHPKVDANDKLMAVSVYVFYQKKWTVVIKPKTETEHAALVRGSGTHSPTPLIVPCGFVLNTDQNARSAARRVLAEYTSIQVPLGLFPDSFYTTRDTCTVAGAPWEVATKSFLLELDEGHSPLFSALTSFAGQTSVTVSCPPSSPIQAVTIIPWQESVKMPLWKIHRLVLLMAWGLMTLEECSRIIEDNEEKKQGHEDWIVVDTNK